MEGDEMETEAAAPPKGERRTQGPLALALARASNSRSPSFSSSSLSCSSSSSSSMSREKLGEGGGGARARERRAGAAEEGVLAAAFLRLWSSESEMGASYSNGESRSLRWAEVEVEVESGDRRAPQSIESVGCRGARAFAPLARSDDAAAAPASPARWRWRVTAAAEKRTRSERTIEGKREKKK